jgi:hypothetical protein
VESHGQGWFGNCILAFAALYYVHCTAHHQITAISRFCFCPSGGQLAMVSSGCVPICLLRFIFGSGGMTLNWDMSSGVLDGGRYGLAC